MAKLLTRIISVPNLFRLEPSHLVSVRFLRGRAPEDARTLKQRLEGWNRLDSIGKINKLSFLLHYIYFQKLPSEKKTLNCTSKSISDYRSSNYRGPRNSVRGRNSSRIWKSIPRRTNRKFRWEKWRTSGWKRQAPITSKPLLNTSTSFEISTEKRISSPASRWKSPIATLPIPLLPFISAIRSSPMR